MKRIFLLSLCAAFASNVNAGQVIDVLFVFDNDANVLIPNKQSWVNTQIAAANNNLAQSGAPILTFNATVREGSIGYDATGKSQQIVINWMYGSGLAQLQTMREGHDLVIMIVQDFIGSACGVSILRDVVAQTNNDVAQFGAMALGGCENPPGNVLAHEFGHLLSLEHQVARDSNGFILLDGDDPAKPSNSRSVDVPETSNHGYWEDFQNNNSPRSLMANPTSDQYTFGRFTDGGSPYDSTYEDAMDVLGIGFFGLGSWDAVSRYRDPLPPPSCNASYISIQPLVCNGNNRSVLVTASLPGYTVTNARYELDIGSNGIWSIIFEGILSCPFFNTNIGGLVRVILETQYGTASCQRSFSVPSCPEGGWQW